MENSLDCSVMWTCRIGAGIGAGMWKLEESCRASSCRIAVLEVYCEDCNAFCFEWSTF